MYDWGKKRKMLVFTGVYVCVKAKLTFVSFFPFFLHLSLRELHTLQEDQRLAVRVFLQDFLEESGSG